MSDLTRLRENLRQGYLSNPLTAHLNEDLVRQALDGLPAQPIRTFEWLTQAIQIALYLGNSMADCGDGQKSKADVRNELRKLSKRISKLWVDLANRSTEADDAMSDLAWQHSVQRNDIGEPAELQLFSEGSHRLEWMGHFLRRAAEELDSEITTREAQATQQHHRIVLAQHLGEVFEKAYERVATHKTAGSNNHPETYGVWPDFFYRVLKAADVKGASDNLGDVLRAARRLRKLEGVLFPLGLLPE